MVKVYLSTKCLVDSSHLFKAVEREISFIPGRELWQVSIFGLFRRVFREMYQSLVRRGVFQWSFGLVGLADWLTNWFPPIKED